MNLSQDIKPISYLKSKTADVINTVNDSKRAMIITQNGEAKAVVQDIKSYENLQCLKTLLETTLILLMHPYPKSKANSIR